MPRAPRKPICTYTDKKPSKPEEKALEAQKKTVLSLACFAVLAPKEVQKIEPKPWTPLMYREADRNYGATMILQALQVQRILSSMKMEEESFSSESFSSESSELDLSSDPSSSSSEEEIDLEK